MISAARKSQLFREHQVPTEASGPGLATDTSTSAATPRSAEVRLRDVAMGELPRNPGANPFGIGQMDFLPGGRTLLTTGGMHTVYLWDVSELLAAPSEEAQRPVASE